MYSLKPIIHYKKSRKVGSSANVKINSTMKTYIHNILTNFLKKKEGRKLFSQRFRKQLILSHDDEHVGSLILDDVEIVQWKCGLET